MYEYLKAIFLPFKLTNSKIRKKNDNHKFITLNYDQYISKELMNMSKIGFNYQNHL